MSARKVSKRARFAARMRRERFLERVLALMSGLNGAGYFLWEQCQLKPVYQDYRLSDPSNPPKGEPIGKQA